MQIVEKIKKNFQKKEIKFQNLFLKKKNKVAKHRKIKKNIKNNKQKQKKEMETNQNKTHPEKRQKKIKKNKSNNFLLSTYKMLQDETNQKIVRWKKTKKSFIITDPEKISSILPKYFKTKNFASFVRQLNLYGFRKIKNLENLDEFGHELFMQDNLENIKKIKRKKIDKKKIIKFEKNDKKGLINEFQKLKKKFDEQKKNMDLYANQNKRLMESNKDMVCQIYFYKKDLEIRMRKICFLFFVLSSQYDENLSKTVLQSLKKHEIFRNTILKKDFKDYILFVDLVSKRIFESEDDVENWVNGLLDKFKEKLDLEGLRGLNGEEERDFGFGGVRKLEKLKGEEQQQAFDEDFFDKILLESQVSMSMQRFDSDFR